MNKPLERPNPWLPVFFASLLLELTAVWFGLSLLRHISKPLLMISLTSWFIIRTADRTSAYKKTIIAALLFAWLGDVLLLFEKDGPLFFIFGLGSFLVAHLLYVWSFVLVRKSLGTRIRPLWAIPLLVYFVALIFLLGPLAGLTWPVRIYGLTIVTMLFMAIQLVYYKGGGGPVDGNNATDQPQSNSLKRAGISILIGALLFVISDTILAADKFYKPFSGSGLLVMSTYALAQFLIVRGAVMFIRYNPRTDLRP